MCLLNSRLEISLCLYLEKSKQSKQFLNNKKGNL